MKTKALLILSILFATASFAQMAPHPKEKTGPRVLAVIAHPDDEGAFSATLYKVTHELNGIADIFVITNGEAGYKYSTLAESIYGLELTDEKVGRKHLPAIRRQELINAGKVIGIRNIYFINQTDAHYGQNEREPLDTSWNTKFVEDSLNRVLLHNRYDFVFCLPPVPQTHGGHKAASILAVKGVAKLPAAKRPIVMAGSVISKKDTLVRRLGQLGLYSETATLTDTANFKVHLSAPIGFNGKLNYNIIKAWEIAEHKSQGTMQLFMGRQSDYEVFWYFKLNGEAGLPKAAAFFEKLKNVPYDVKVYPASAGNQ